MRLAMAISVLAVLSGPAMADDAYAHAWCDGYQAALTQLEQNRMHWRTVLGQPKETHRQTIQRLFSQPPGGGRDGPNVPDSADLYLMLPPLDPDMGIMLPSGSIIHCPASPS